MVVAELHAVACTLTKLVVILAHNLDQALGTDMAVPQPLARLLALFQQAHRREQGLALQLHVFGHRPLRQLIIPDDGHLPLFVHKIVQILVIVGQAVEADPALQQIFGEERFVDPTDG